MCLHIFFGCIFFFFFSSRRRHTRYIGDWSSDVCSSDLPPVARRGGHPGRATGGVASLKREVRKGQDSAHSSAANASAIRSEERRVGKECRSRWAAGPQKKKEKNIAIKKKEQ